MNKKYILTSESISNTRGCTLYRIKALRDFGDVRAGDLGGFVAFEKNLSHVGNCWVYEEAYVSKAARISGDARVSGKVEIFGDARVSGKATICGNARVFTDAQVSGEATVSGNVWVYGDAQVYGTACVYGNVWVCGKTQICGTACICVDKHVHVDANVKVNRGVWNQKLTLNGGIFLMSSTLEKILVGYLYG